MRGAGLVRGWRHRRRCRRLARACRQDILTGYIAACARLHADAFDNTPMIAADLELTGLDPRRDEIVAIGWTLLDRGRIALGSNRQLLINADASVGRSATIHELLDSELAAGLPPQAGLEALFRAAKGRCWIFHHAALDVAFLQRACRAWAGVAPPFVLLDTLQIELTRRRRRELPVKNGDLQLGRLRSQYHLPQYRSHGALTDAVATAELLQAIVSRLDTEKSLPIGRYLKIL
ncbi:MAG: exonuclease domain-containing protein [Xanthomonadales bacterium]|nr:exonuclease domain-containing protein [Xanthomonadales bacterium]